MDYVVYAVPFFVLAIVGELVYGRSTGNNTYRLNDSIGSLMLGVLSQARKLLTVGVGGYVYYLITQYFSLPLMAVDSWLTWVVAFVVYDFCYYWLHRMGHERTILWAAHVAHHQSEDYNLSTALRQTSTGFLLGWIFYIPMFLLGIPAEVVVSVGSLNLIYQFWVHTEHLPKLGWYEKYFVTASNHRVHHAQNDIYLDRNYGGVFILWDRWFGTFQEELDDEPPIFGIRGPLRSFNPFKALTHIYVDMARDSWRTKNWGDKLRVWVARTGWRPADVAASDPREKPDLARFKKYDPDISALAGFYAIGQLIALVLAMECVRRLELSQTQSIFVWCMIMVTTITTAGWLDRWQTARLARWELLRLAVIGIALSMLSTATVPAGLLFAAWAYVGLSLAAVICLTRAGSEVELAS